MEEKTMGRIGSWFYGAASAQLLFRDDILTAVNSYGQKLLPGLSPGQTIDEVLGEAAEAFRQFSGEGSMLFPVDFSGMMLDAKLTSLEDAKLVELIEPLDVLSASALRSVAEGILGPMTAVMSLTPKLLPQLEQIGDPKNMARAAQVNQGLYAMYRAAANIRFAASEKELRLSRKRINVISWLKNLGEKLYPLCELSQRKLVLDLPEAQWFCDLDSDQMERALLNLVSNALKFTEKNEGEICITASKTGTGKLRISVRDNGCGIPAYEMGIIFQRKEHRPQIPDSRQGIGLGLPIARKILRAHGGNLLVESVETVGTAVHLMLPVCRSQDALILSTEIVRPDYSGGFDKYLLGLADALPSEAFDTRGVDL